MSEVPLYCKRSIRIYAPRVWPREVIWTILKLTFWVSGTNPSTFDRKRARAHRIAEPEPAFEAEVAVSDLMGPFFYFITLKPRVE